MQTLERVELHLIDQQFEAIIKAGELEVTAPENEIYGRSLGTIRRLGSAMLSMSYSEAVMSPEAQQAKVEFFTSVEEGFGTDIELGGGLEVRDFDVRPVIDGRVMAKDLRTSISDMTQAGLECAAVTLQSDSRFAPQFVRSVWDHTNALTVDAMARRETPYNTRIVISPFPEEAALESGDEYWQKVGYVPHLKRSFVQLYHVDKLGQLTSGSLSFDGSDKHKLREVLLSYGVEIPADETTDNWLKYAYVDTLSVDGAKYLATEIADISGETRVKKTTNTVDVTGKHRPLMERVFSESYVHVCESLVRGHQTPELQQLVRQLARYAHTFKSQYAKSLYAMQRDTSSFTKEDSIVLHELLVYSAIEMMRSLHLGENASLLYDSSSETLQQKIGAFVSEGAISNRTYSACGLSISAGGGEGGPQGAFGGVDHGEDMYGPLDFQCRKGHWNRRPPNTLIAECKTCGDSLKC